VLELCFDVFLTESLLSSQTLARFEARSKEKKRGLQMLGRSFV
jgi:hypothetical protein